MKLGSKNQDRTYLVIGLGRFGKSLCLRLAETGAHVIAVDKLRTVVEEVSDKLEYVAQIDAIDEKALTKIGAKDVDIAIVCLGEKSEAAILVTAILLDLGVPFVIARASGELQGRILHKVGAHKVIFPEVETGRHVADLLENPWLTHFAQLGDGEGGLIVGKIPAQPDMIGRTLRQLALPARYGLMVTVVERGKKKLLPGADLAIQQDDKIWLFGEQEKMAPLMETLKIDEDEQKDLEESK